MHHLFLIPLVSSWIHLKLLLLLLVDVEQRHPINLMRGKYSGLKLYLNVGRNMICTVHPFYTRMSHTPAAESSHCLRILTFSLGMAAVVSNTLENQCYTPFTYFYLCTASRITRTATQKCSYSGLSKTDNIATLTSCYTVQITVKLVWRFQN